MTATLSAIQPVDFARYNTDFSGFAADMGASFTRYGFAVIANHGLPPALTDGTLERFQQFFALPEDAKRRYHVPGQGGARGYTPFGIETAKGATHRDLKEFWHLGRELPAGHAYRRFMPDNVWVEEVPGFREHAYGLFEAFDTLGARLLRSIACFLQLPLDYFADKVAFGNSVLRVLHYPPVPAGAVGARAGAHEDINVITLLLGAEEAGLQLLDRDGKWLDINPPGHCVVVNIGDMLQRLTNHRLPSTTHRVINPTPDRVNHARWSLPYFLHFNPDFTIRTLPSCVDSDHPDRYPESITADEYLQERLREIKLL
jgi:isopenicillin N synthase-like dioxygenase